MIVSSDAHAAPRLPGAQFAQIVIGRPAPDGHFLEIGELEVSDPFPVRREEGAADIEGARERDRIVPAQRSHVQLRLPGSAGVGEMRAVGRDRDVGRDVVDPQARRRDSAALAGGRPAVKRRRVVSAPRPRRQRSPPTRSPRRRGAARRAAVSRLRWMSRRRRFGGAVVALPRPTAARASDRVRSASDRRDPSRGTSARSRSSAGGATGRTSEIRGGSSFRIAPSRLARVFPSNALRPVSISNSTQPNANRSVRASASRPSICSGAMYWKVPRIVPAAVTPAAGVVGIIDKPLTATTGALVFASPKSSSFAPAFVSMTLPGLRSRWTMPARCAASSAEATWMAIVERLLDSGSGGPACRASGAARAIRRRAAP